MVKLDHQGKGKQRLRKSGDQRITRHRVVCEGEEETKFSQQGGGEKLDSPSIDMAMRQQSVAAAIKAHLSMTCCMVMELG